MGYLSNNILDANLNNILTENLTNVLDNIGKNVLDNLSGTVGQVINQSLNSTDLSNNSISTALRYTLQFPTN